MTLFLHNIAEIRIKQVQEPSGTRLTLVEKDVPVHHVINIFASDMGCVISTVPQVIEDSVETPVL